jgi:hypothetical protein
MKSVLNRAKILWDDGTFGRHALLSRGWEFADKPDESNFIKLTIPWRFESSSYSSLFFSCVLKLWSDGTLADMPSCLGGGEFGINVV